MSLEFSWSSCLPWSKSEESPHQWLLFWVLFQSCCCFFSLGSGRWWAAMLTWVPWQKVHRGHWKALPDQTIKWHHRGRINSARTADRSGAMLSKGRNTQACLERGGLLRFTLWYAQEKRDEKQPSKLEMGFRKDSKSPGSSGWDMFCFVFSLVSKCKQK